MVEKQELISGVRVCDLVVTNNDLIPLTWWSIDQIVEICQDPDGLARIISVNTKGNIRLKRSIN